MAKTAGEMFGPLNFENLTFGIQSHDHETKCMLCEDSFNLHLRLDIFLCHMFDVHKVVIEDAQNIKILPEYVSYWKNRFKHQPIEEIIPSVRLENTGEQYFLISSLLEVDKELRHKLTLDFVIKVQEFERTDENFHKQCLFCKLQFEGSRQGYVDHLRERHNLQLGPSENMVFIEELINRIEQKLLALTCIYCEGVFPDRAILKEHMRKKLHKRINPSDSQYDKYFTVNYLEMGKDWRVIDQEGDRYAHPPGFEENSDSEYLDWEEDVRVQITCLFCDHTETDINLMLTHMDGQHCFNFVQVTTSLNFYQKVKLVNFFRKMVHANVCPYCGVCLESKVELGDHLKKYGHYKMPEMAAFDQPEYYFPTYENDAFLYLIKDIEMLKITCLFCDHTESDIKLMCTHIDREHDFDFIRLTTPLNFYQKVKLVNFVRKMLYGNFCPYCEISLENRVELEEHLKKEGHYKMPEVSTFDRPEYYFPTDENDAFLYLLDDIED